MISNTASWLRRKIWTTSKGVPMDIEREILAWVTRVDMFIISTWPYVLLAVILYVMMLLAWTISDCVIRIQKDD